MGYVNRFIKRHFANNNKRGAALLLAIMLGVVIMAVVTPLFNVVLLEQRMSGLQGHRTSAFYLADAGAQYALYQLETTKGAWKGTTTPIYLTRGTETVGHFTVSMESTINNFGHIVYTARSIGRPLNSLSIASIESKYRRDAYGDYMFLIDNFGSTSMGTEDYVTGRVHSNSDLPIRGAPVYLRTVSTSGVIKKYTDNTRNPSVPYGPAFHEGYVEKIGKKPLPSVSDFMTLKGKAQANGLYISPSSDVTLTLNGKILTAYYKTGSKYTTVNYDITSGNGVVYINDHDIYISGLLNGQVTIAVNNDVFVTGNLYYQDTTETSDDLLGLIAKRNITVKDSAPSDFLMCAEMLAVDGTVSAECLRKKTISRVYGSIAAKNMGGFLINGKGYAAQQWLYDNRLKFLQPPNYFSISNDEYYQVYWKNSYFM